MFFSENKQVNKGKQDNLYNTENMLWISEIQQNTMIMKDWGLRWVIKIEWVNIDLKEDEEIWVIIEQYKRFLNSLEFPIQILVRNTYLDLTPYISYMSTNRDKIKNQTLRNQADAYIDYLENINLQKWLIFVKHFYMIVPFYPPIYTEIDSVKKPRRQKLMNVLESSESAEKIVERYRKYLQHRDKLDSRCNLIINALQWMQMSASRLSMSDMVSLFFSSYNPLAQNSQS